MKKFLSLTMAAACALSCAVFGLTACSGGEKDSDEVTAEEWAAAMASDNVLNVTMKATYSSEEVYTEGSITETEKASGSAEVKTAFERYNGAATGGIFIKGNAYMYSSETYTSTDSDGTVTESSAETQYEVFEDNAHSYVSKYTETDEEDWWDGDTYAVAGTVLSSDAYSMCEMFLAMYEDEYADFEYVDGAYKCTDSGVTVYIKINDGYLTSLVMESSATMTYNGYSYTSTMKYDIKFSNYGSTTVTVPEEYTYANYLKNHAA